MIVWLLNTLSWQGNWGIIVGRWKKIPGLPNERKKKKWMNIWHKKAWVKKWRVLRRCVAKNSRISESGELLTRFWCDLLLQVFPSYAIPLPPPLFIPYCRFEYLLAPERFTGLLSEFRMYFEGNGTFYRPCSLWTTWLKLYLNTKYYSSNSIIVN